MTQELELQNYHRPNALFNYLLKLVTMYVNGNIRKPRRHIRYLSFNYARLFEIRDYISKFWVGSEYEIIDLFHSDFAEWLIL